MKTIIIIVTFIFISITIFGQTKMGYFEVDSIRTVLPAYKTSELKFKEIENSLNDSLNIMTQKLELFYNKNFIKTDYSWDSTLERHYKDSIINLVEAVENYKENSLEKMRILRESEFGNLDSILNIYIMKFCRIYNFDCLIDKTSIFYCTKCLDKTRELMDFIIEETKE